MRVSQTIVALVGAAAIVAIPTSAQDAKGMLVIAKMTGACGVMDSLINFQATTKMTGGDEFVTRFWAVEAARLGMSVQGLSDQCNQSIAAYDKLMKAAPEP